MYCLVSQTIGHDGWISISILIIVLSGLFLSFHPRDAAQRVERNSVVVIVKKNETIKQLYTREKKIQPARK